MVKQRMTALDVRATVEEMRAKLIGLRLLNLYDLSSKMFLFKFGQGENKQSVLLENGVRLHLTDLVREKPRVPSQFTLKLRKHVRAWRLDSITQLQHDRTVDLCFGVASTSGSFHIIIELFSKGNVILTDHEYNIMMLLRTHKDEDVKLMVREPYPVTRSFEERMQDEGSVALTGIGSTTQSQAHRDPQEQQQERPPDTTSAGGGADDSGAEDAQRAAERARRERCLREEWATCLERSSPADSLKAILSGVHHFGPGLAEHVLTVTNTPNEKKKDLSMTPAATEDLFNRLLPGLLEAWDVIYVALPPGGYLVKQPPAPPSAGGGGVGGKKASQQQQQQTKGKGKTYIPVHPSPPSAPAEAHPVAEPSAPSATEASASAPASSSPAPAAAAVGGGGGGGTTTVLNASTATHYDDFSPVLLAQYKTAGATAVYRDSYGKVCDEFFLFTETERIDQQNTKKETAAMSKREKFERDHQRRISALEKEQEDNHHKGEMIILNAERIDEAIGLINGALAAGIQWDALRSLLKRRHAEGHPVAYMIHDLHLERNAMSVLLEQELYDDEDDNDVPPVVVEVNLSKTAQANATDYFRKKKASAVKLEKTLAATEKAAAGAARKGERAAAKQQSKKLIVVERKRGWWEKYAWFRTSAGDVVLQGKDVQSTDILIRRMTRLGDLVVHCDVDGALPCVLRPLTTVWRAEAAASSSAVAQPIAMASVTEAAGWCVSRSAAWDAKQSVGAWWVYASQVSGGHASTGYFFDGERHHVRPQPLSLGCGLLFAVQRDIRHEAVDGQPPAELEGCVLSTLPVTPSDGQASASTHSGLIEGEDYVAADPQKVWHPLPAWEVKRKTVTVPPHPSPSHTHPSSKAQGGTGHKKSEVKPSAVPSSASKAAVAESSPTTTTGTTGTTGTPSAPLSRQQRKKLKKIQGKYADQDEEDRIRGALLNGNQLAKVQIKELEAAAARAREAAEEAKQAAKEERAQQRRKGKLRYVPVEDKEEDSSTAQKGPHDEGKGDKKEQKQQQHQRKKQKALAGGSTDDDEEEEEKEASTVVRAPTSTGSGKRGNKTLHSDPNPSQASAPAAATAVPEESDEDEEDVEEVSDFTEDEKEQTEAPEAAEEKEGADTPHAHRLGSSSSSSDDDDDDGDGIKNNSEKGGDEAEEGVRSDGEAEVAKGEPPSSSSPSLSKREEKSSPAGGARGAPSEAALLAAAAASDAELRDAIVHYTSRPSPTDIVLHVLCVCAPYATLMPYAYRVALVSGNEKKGKVAELILNHFRLQAAPSESKDGAQSLASGRGSQSASHTASFSSVSVSGGGAGGSGKKGPVPVPSPNANPVVAEALRTYEVTEMVEQLRGNCKPQNLRSQK